MALNGSLHRAYDIKDGEQYGKPVKDRHKGTMQATVPTNKT
jgi:hypothetical protein